MAAKEQPLLIGIDRHDFCIPYDPKPIVAAIFTPTDHLSYSTAPLIFAHGAGGSMHTDAVTNFRAGFATRGPCICFQGTMNLTSRVKLFKAVVDYQHQYHPAGPSTPVLGGRSMGARAAVLAATECIAEVPATVAKLLVLVSYPLQDAKERLRDQILLELDPSFAVIFVCGDRDTMCNLDQLCELREKMECQTWLVRVEGADHGMVMKPARATNEIVKLTGVVVAEWLKTRDEGQKEGRVRWDEEEECAKFNGWSTKADPGQPQLLKDVKEALNVEEHHANQAKVKSISRTNNRAGQKRKRNAPEAKSAPETPAGTDQNLTGAARPPRSKRSNDNKVRSVTEANAAPESGRKAVPATKRKGGLESGDAQEHVSSRTRRRNI